MAFQEGPPMRKRWPVGLIAVGFGLLAIFTNALPQATNFLEQTIWWVAAAAVSGVSVAFMFFGTAKLRRLSAACIIAFSILRSLGSINAATYTPVSVWLIVIGLTVAAYKSQLRVEEVEIEIVEIEIAVQEMQESK